MSSFCHSINTNFNCKPINIRRERKQESQQLMHIFLPMVQFLLDSGTVLIYSQYSQFCSGCRRCQPSHKHFAHLEKCIYDTFIAQQVGLSHRLTRLVRWNRVLSNQAVCIMCLVASVCTHTCVGGKRKRGRECCRYSASLHEQKMHRKAQTYILIQASCRSCGSVPLVRGHVSVGFPHDATYTHASIVDYIVHLFL